MKQKDVIKKLIDKTYSELNQPKKPVQVSRVWKTPEGYKFLVQWSNLVLLRILVKKVIDDLKLDGYNPPSSSRNPVNSSSFPIKSPNLPLNKSLLARLESQILDALRSAIANIEEGWKRTTTGEYLQFIGYSQGSLEEAKGDINRMLQDELMTTVKGSSLMDLGIDLKKWNNWCRNPLNSSRLLYFPLKGNKGYLKDIKGKEVTYEMLIELFNKTDYLLRKLVESLEKKLNLDQKGYQVHKARYKVWSTKGR